jgi:hypothetical protein
LGSRAIPLGEFAMSMTRQTFLRTGAAAVAARTLPRAEALVSSGAGLKEFGYSEVVLEGRLRAQFDTNHAFYAALNEDNLLRPYRLRAGLAAPGTDLGGWYSDDPSFDPHLNGSGLCPGGPFGQYISALSRAYAVTHAPATKAKVERLVHGLAPTLNNRLFRDYNFPAYTVDKLQRGLIDAAQLAGVRDALPLLDKAADAVLPHLPEKALSRTEMFLRPHAVETDCWDESYTLPENFFLAYKATGKERFRQLGIRFLEDDTFFNPLSVGENVLVGEHAYSHMNALSSAMQAYLTLGSDKHLRAAKNGFDFVAAQSFATGGWGPDENFRKPGTADFGGSLYATHNHFETCCGSYAHFKLCRYLLTTTADSRYGDSMERVLYNAALGILPVQPDGRGFYYSDYNGLAGRKAYHPDRWHCCTGSFPMLTGDYAISAFFRTAHALYVNLYVPSTVRFGFDGAAASLRIETAYPYRPEITLHIDTDRAAVFALNVRIPAWAGAATTVAVNGTPVAAEPLPGQFLSLKREWHRGDRIEITLDLPLRLEPVDPEHPEIVAPVIGPLALFTLENGTPAPNRPELLAGMPVKLARRDLQAIRHSAAEEWTMPSAAGPLRLKSFADITTERYRLYHRLDPRG